MNNFTDLVDLAAHRLGGRVLAANDEFFAPKENLLKPSKPIFVEGKYTARGKWMDGWETRRRRTPGHDWCLIRLGLAGVVRGFVVDTSFFKGNYPERCSIEACSLPHVTPGRELKALLSPHLQWFELLPQAALSGDARNLFAIDDPRKVTHLRLRIFPDGGVARLRVHGEVVARQTSRAQPEIDLVAIANGGRVIASSDQFFGTPLNLLVPGQPKNMGDGWETRRRRGPGHDWVILKLGTPGAIHRAEVDTAHFKGNFPESCSLETIHAPDATDESLALQSDGWRTLLPRNKLKPNHHHIFRRELHHQGIATHVRLSIFPDGGVGRLRLYGRPEHSSDSIARFNQMSQAQARKALLDCCGSKRWAQQMLAQRPFAGAADLLQAADSVWTALSHRDWLEAFRHHPPIGGKKARATQSTAAKKWSAGEQAKAIQASVETLQELAAGNQAYHAKFGHVFLICAAGKSADQILQNLRQRLANHPSIEIAIAAAEQRKITCLRLEKLLR